ncbi:MULTISPECIES: polysaccharide biosynthesis/export family protein [Brevundimonas]|uniref:Polysaccharide export protein n=1 Tax=Brevundimonas vesicularis TaxID=41276 RepID=A0ABU4KTH4_BREVE|nr:MULTISPECIES: polysaccharide biosynthesis/export family protein [Brevundimonas]MDX2336159.1 polysaccharide export protein [Brevundimonas vesicularis]
MSKIVLNRRLFVAAGALSLAGCQSVPVADDAAAAETRTVGDYQLDAGDKIRLNVFGEEELSGEFVVSSAGLLSIPLAGDIPAKGRTIQEVQRSVEAALRAGYILNPQVSAEVLTYRPFYVLGEVNKPGTYPYAAGLTVLNAVATAGGFTYRGDTRRIFIRRDGSQREEVYKVTSTLQVAPGDTLRIAERLF